MVHWLPVVVDWLVVCVSGWFSGRLLVVGQYFVWIDCRVDVSWLIDWLFVLCCLMWLLCWGVNLKCCNWLIVHPVLLVDGCRPIDWSSVVCLLIDLSVVDCLLMYVVVWLLVGSFVVCGYVGSLFDGLVVDVLIYCVCCGLLMDRADGFVSLLYQWVGRWLCVKSCVG